MLPKSVRWMVWIPPIVIYGFIFWFSSRPVLPGPEGLAVQFVWFKTAHLIIYAALTFFTWIAWRSLHADWKAVLLTWYLIMTLAALDELHQMFVPPRTGRPLDVFIDLLAAWTVLQAVSRYNEASKENNSGM